MVNRQITIPDMAFFLVCFTLAAGAGLIRGFYLLGAGILYVAFLVDAVVVGA